MITEYHLTGSAQGLLSLSPILPVAAKNLLPPVEDYILGGASQGTRDMRVVDRAKVLRIATWLHCLDMSAHRDMMSSETLDVTWHSKGLLLDLFLGPMMSSLTFAQVVECVLDENQCRTESLLDDLQGCHAQIQEELDKLIEAHRDETNSSSWRKIKKEIDLRQKDLKSLKATISYHESNLGQDPQTFGDDPEAAEVEMAAAPEADEGHTMEVDDKDGDPPSASPVSPADDDLLTGGGAAGVEGGMASLTVLSPEHHDASGEDASV